MNRSIHRCLILGLIFIASQVIAAEADDLAAIQQILKQYRATQDSGDLLGQGRLMIPDRVWIGPNGERRTDNVENMRVQQAEAELQKKEIPGLQRFTMDRDVLIKFHGEGRVAIVSFYRTAVIVFPPHTSRELKEQYGGYSETGTLVLEKQKEGWKIVHTQWTPPSG